MNYKLNIFKNTIKVVLGLSAFIFAVSCEEAFEFDLPEAGSKVDTSLPTADFTYIPNALDFKTIEFNNLSTESIKYLWDFGGGDTSTDKDPSYTFAAGEGTYPVTLTALDANEASTTVTLDVDVVDKFVPLPVTIINGDMEDSSNGWKISFSNGWSGNGFESSGDGSWLRYDGTDNGSKTRGAKWNALRSAGSLANSNTRHAYQAIIVSPTTPDRTVKYILEFEYAIKDDTATDPPEGRIVVADILDGHFTDGYDAYLASDAGGGTSLMHFVGSEVKGKTVFTTVKQEFTTNASGEVSIWIWAVTPVDLYVDNVKVYAAN